MEDFRSTPLNAGIISTAIYTKIISALQEVGVSGIAMTGGEPFLNKDWDKIADHAKDV
jgi:molybdenum cofactor biosynthesis enzyme MoaA